LNHADKRASDKNHHFSIIHVATSVLFSFRFQQCLKQAGKMHVQLDIMIRENYQLQNRLTHQGQGIIKLSKRIKS